MIVDAILLPSAKHTKPELRIQCSTCSSKRNNRTLHLKISILLGQESYARDMLRCGAALLRRTAAVCVATPPATRAIVSVRYTAVHASAQKDCGLTVRAAFRTGIHAGDVCELSSADFIHAYTV